MEFVLQRDAGANSGVPNSGVATSASSAASSRGSDVPEISSQSEDDVSDSSYVMVSEFSECTVRSC